MKEIEDGEKNQNRILLAPVVAYMLAGYGLLFSVYRVELLADKLCDYCRYFRPLTFSVTAWHESQMWISLLFPVTWPVLALRALLLLLAAVTCAGLEILFSNLGLVYAWIWQQLAWIGASIHQGVVLIVSTLRGWIHAAALMIWGWVRQTLRAIYSGLTAIRKELVAAARYSVRVVAPVAIGFWLAIVSPIRWLWQVFRLAVTRVAFWIRLSLVTIWRGLVSAGIWLSSMLRALGRQLYLALRTFGRWIVASMRAIGAWLLIPLRWLRAALVELRHRVIYAAAVTWRWTLMSLRTIGAWLLIPLRWLWAGLVELRHRVVYAATVIWRRTVMSLRAIGTWLLIPLRWFWAGLVEMGQRVVHAAAITWRGFVSTLRSIGQRLLLPLRMLWSGLIELWFSLGLFLTYVMKRLWIELHSLGELLLRSWAHMATITRLILQGLVTLLTTLWGWVMAPLTRLWAGIQLIWKQIRVSAASVWVLILNAAHWLGFTLVTFWELVLATFHLAWRIVAQNIFTITGWITAGLRALWRSVTVLWIAITGNIHAAWAWLIDTLHLGWDIVVLVGRTLWQPIQAAGAAVFSLLRSIRKQVGRMLELAWSPIRVLGETIGTLWQQAKATFRSFGRQVMNLLNQTRTALTARLKTLYRSTGFWKRLFANLRVRRTELMAYLIKFRANLGAPLQGIKDRIATLATGLRDQIRTIVRDTRQWLAELRDQVRTSAGDSRQRVSEIREDTAETLRNIIPGGRT